MLFELWAERLEIFRNADSEEASKMMKKEEKEENRHFVLICTNWTSTHTGMCVASDGPVPNRLCWLFVIGEFSLHRNFTDQSCCMTETFENPLDIFHGVHPTCGTRNLLPQ